MRYVVKPEDPREDGNPGRFFILDTETGKLKLGKNEVLLGYRKRKDADTSARKLNESLAQPLPQQPEPSPDD